MDYRPEALDHADWGWPLNPVTTINLFEAVAYACWARPMAAATAGAPAPRKLRAWWLAVPSEVLWEAGQRAGHNGLPAPVSPPPAGWGALDFNHAASGWGRPSPVGVFSMAYGPAGQADGRGNVSEWCCNALPQGLQPYHWPGERDLAQADWDGSSDQVGIVRALRGGAFEATASQCRLSYRRRDLPGLRHSVIGVRLVRVWPPHSEH